VTKPDKATLDIYGFAMLDSGYNFGQIDPNWFDVVRPTKLPAFQNEFGNNGVLFASARQTRFGVKSKIPTKYGDLKTVFEFELFGVALTPGYAVSTCFTRSTGEREAHSCDITSYQSKVTSVRRITQRITNPYKIGRCRTNYSEAPANTVSIASVGMSFRFIRSRAPDKGGYPHRPQHCY
jgi:hypothetical protein